MADIPTNDIIVIASEDTDLENTGKPNKQEPSLEKQEKGYDFEQSLFCEEYNYIANNHGVWLEYLFEKVKELESSIGEGSRVSIGEIIEIFGDARNPAVIKDYGTWEPFGVGQVLVGVGEFTDTNGTTVTWADGETAGTYRHTLTTPELPAHSHSVTGNTENDTHFHYAGIAITGEDADTEFGISALSDGTHNVFTGLAADGSVNSANTNSDTHNHSINFTSGTSGSGNDHNIMQPTLAVYRWIRTA